MFKYLLLSLALLITPALAECKPGDDTQEKFFSYVTENKWEAYTLTDAGNKKLIDRINFNRANAGKEPIPADSKFYFARIGGENTGTAVMSKGCALSEFVLVFPSAFLANVFEQAGVLPDEIIKANVGIPL